MTPRRRMSVCRGDVGRLCGQNQARGQTIGVVAHDRLAEHRPPRGATAASAPGRGTTAGRSGRLVKATVPPALDGSSRPTMTDALPARAEESVASSVASSSVRPTSTAESTCGTRSSCCPWAKPITPRIDFLAACGAVLLTAADDPRPISHQPARGFRRERASADTMAAAPELSRAIREGQRDGVFRGSGTSRGVDLSYRRPGERLRGFVGLRLAISKRQGQFTVGRSGLPPPVLPAARAWAI